MPSTVPSKIEELLPFAAAMINGLTDHAADFPENSAARITAAKNLYETRAAQLATVDLIKEDTADALDGFKNVIKSEISKATDTDEKLSKAKLYLNWTGSRYKYGPPAKVEELFFTRNGSFCRINWQKPPVSATNTAAKHYVLEIDGVIKYVGSASECEVEAASGAAVKLTAYNDVGAGEALTGTVTV